MSARDVVRSAIAALNPVWLEPPVLQPAALYLELAGEDLRRRAFLVADDSQGDLCLRPDMTAPAVREAFALPVTPPLIAYEGLVFRQQEAGGGQNEFVQIGAEWIGGAMDIEAEADVIARAIAACRAAGVEPHLRLGDLAIRAGFVAGCNLGEDWAARTMSALDHPSRLDSLALHAREDEGEGLAEALAGLSAPAAEAVVADVLRLARITPVGARPIAEIAQRLQKRGKLEANPGPNAAQRDLLKALAAIDAGDGLAQARALTNSPALAAPQAARNAVDRAEARVAALAKRTTLPTHTRFAPGLGRALSYYDGFVFELEAKDGKSLGGGGRYDALARALWPPGPPAPQSLGAAGFALRPARLDEAAA